MSLEALKWSLESKISAKEDCIIWPLSITRVFKYHHILPRPPCLGSPYSGHMYSCVITVLLLLPPPSLPLLPNPSTVHHHLGKQGVRQINVFFVIIFWSFVVIQTNRDDLNAFASRSHATSMLQLPEPSL